MDVATIKEAFNGTILWCCVGAVGLMALAGLAVAVWKTPGKIMEFARKRGWLYVIGDLDPFSCPPGSTNTVWEHVFYTGTTNAPFAYPQATDETAVLRVSVSGTGSGELVVGDRVVPLLPPFSASPMLSHDASQAEVFMALAKYVPAVSGAVGGRMVPSRNKIENHDLNADDDYRSGWGRVPIGENIPWKHSDMKDMAYFYVYKLYGELVEKGCLK